MTESVLPLVAKPLPMDLTSAKPRAPFHVFDPADHFAGIGIEHLDTPIVGHIDAPILGIHHDVIPPGVAANGVLVRDVVAGFSGLRASRRSTDGHQHRGECDNLAKRHAQGFREIISVRIT